MVASYVLFIICAIPSLVQSAPAHPSAIREVDNSSAQTGNTCGFEGNSEIYGLGIRLGLYMQWLSAYLLRELLPERVKDLASIMFIFELARFMAAAFLTRESSDTYSIEILILVAMLVGDIWLVHVPISHPFHQRSNATPAGVLARNFMIIAIALFAVWFAAMGSLHYRRDPCGTYLFMFAKIRMGSMNMEYVFFQAMTIVHLLVAALLSFVSFTPIRSADSASFQGWSRICETLRMLLLPMSMPTPSVGAEMASAGQPREELASIYQKAITFSLPLLMAFVICGIELMLEWNAISGVHYVRSTGQLIPLVLGAGSLFRVCYQLFLKHYAQSPQETLATPSETCEEMQTRIIAATTKRSHNRSLSRP